MSNGKLVRHIGTVTTIPMILIAGPLVGFWIGQRVDGRFGTEPWGLVVLTLLGFAASLKQVVQIIRRGIKEETREDS